MYTYVRVHKKKPNEKSQRKTIKYRLMMMMMMMMMMMIIIIIIIIIRVAMANWRQFSLRTVTNHRNMV